MVSLFYHRIASALLRRAMNTEGTGGGLLYPSLFVNPISNRWADYAHHIANCLPPDFSDPPTAHTIWDTPPIQDDDNKNESIGFTFSY